MKRWSKLCDFPVLVGRAVAALEAEARTRPAPERFALVEHVWHLAELETEAFQVRLAQLTTEPAPWLPDFDGDRLARERAYLERSVTAGVRAFHRARAATVRRLVRIRGQAWLRGGFQEHVGYVTLGELPERILAHDKAHAAELGALVAALRPGHALADELDRWAAAIPEPATSPCNRAAPGTSRPARMAQARSHAMAGRPRVASALPLARIHRAVVAGVLRGEVRTAALGRTLGLSPRTLQRRLADHGLTVQCLVEESLRALAIARMRGGADWRAAGLALGFGDPRAFARAFKRWTRVTPSAFQRAPAVTRHGCG